MNFTRLSNPKMASKTSFPTATLTRPDLWLFITVAAYFVMNGAQLWETALMIPAWTQAPPASLIFFQEPYGLDFKVFWIVVHSLHDLTFLFALIFNWNIPARRNRLVFLMAVHAGIRIWTLTYFAPALIEFKQVPYSDTVTAGLVEKASRWRNLNYLRVGAFFMINLCLLPLFRVKVR